MIDENGNAVDARPGGEPVGFDGQWPESDVDPAYTEQALVYDDL